MKAKGIRKTRCQWWHSLITMVQVKGEGGIPTRAGGNHAYQIVSYWDWGAQLKREGGVGAGRLNEGDQRRRGLGVGGVMGHGGERARGRGMSNCGR
jgi:hypothetical protein